MANRQVFPSSLFPTLGDVSGAAGSTSLTVVGIQKIPVSSTAPSTANPQTLAAIGGTLYTPTYMDTAIQINGAPISDDYDIGVNLTLGTTKTPVLVNGA